MVAQFNTIGHSNRSLGDFVDMLRDAQVNLLIDVRSFPRSRANPVFNIEALPDELGAVQIGYRHMPDLGGRRAKQVGIDDSLNAMWHVRSFHNYADYALGDDFTNAFNELTDLGQSQRVALMCSEAVWWRCHRRIITDYLLLNQHPVEHLMGKGHVAPATPTPGALRTTEGKIVYPAKDLK